MSEGRRPCALNKILCFNRTFPIRGFQIYDGPIHLTRCTFKKYVPTPDRYTSAIGFLMKNPWQITPRNNISLVKFGPHVSMSLWYLCSDHGGRVGDRSFPKTKTPSIRDESLQLGGEVDAGKTLIPCTLFHRVQGENRRPM